MHQLQHSIVFERVGLIGLLLVGAACKKPCPDSPGPGPTRTVDSLQDVAMASRLADAAGLNPDKLFRYEVVGYLHHEYGADLIMRRTADTLELFDYEPITVYLRNRGMSSVFTMEPHLVFEDTLSTANK